MTLRVVKIGGSLLTRELLAEELRQWLERQTPAAHLLVMGGGDYANATRALDARFGLGESLCPELCLELLGVTASILASLLPQARRVVDAADWLATGNRPCSGTWIADPQLFLRLADDRELPHTWQVTSDSIAAWLAHVVRAEELVLLKAAAPPSTDMRQLALAGYVDPYFPKAAERLGAIRFETLG